MNKKAKISCILFTIAVLILFFLSSNVYSGPPGVPEPGKRVPPRTVENTEQKRTPPVRRAAPRRAQPAPSKPVVKANPLIEAVALIKQERYRKALPYILCAIKEQPKNADVWYWFGVWCDKTGNFSNAQKYYTKALDIDPNYPALSRIVVYPNDPYGKNPLWDTVRPPAIEAIFPLKDVNVIAYDAVESLREPNPEVPVYLPPDP
jgi:hypothetical protein